MERRCTSEITRDFVVEAGYVGNRGVWWGNGSSTVSAPLAYLNQVSSDRFAAFGLHPYTNPADNLLLSSPLSNPAVIARIGNFLPYPGYSTSNTLINALRPFPQFSTITVTNSATGSTWYDSLQVKATKRMSKGLQVNRTYTFSKAYISTRQNLFDPNSSAKSIQSTDRPHVLSVNLLYQTQKYFSNRLLALATKDWQFGSFLQYASGLPLTPPAATSTNNLPGGSEMYRTGQPLYLKDVNCGCINPYTDQVLNPAAWANPAAGTYGPGPFTSSTTAGAASLWYTDFRAARRPQESFNIGRNIRLGREDRPIVLSIRAEFTNIFNRAQLQNPITGNPLVNPTKNPAGQYNGGFGVIRSLVGAFPATAAVGSASTGYTGLPRQGTLVARITF
jgi:hypothetical protein